MFPVQAQKSGQNIFGEQLIHQFSLERIVFTRGHEEIDSLIELIHIVIHIITFKVIYSLEY